MVKYLKLKGHETIKDVIQNTHDLIPKELFDVTLYSETTYRVKPLFYGRRGGFTILWTKQICFIID